MVKRMTMQVLVKCEVCGKPLESMYCTTNVCRECCESGKCPNESWCAYKRGKVKNEGRVR